MSFRMIVIAVVVVSAGGYVAAQTSGPVKAFGATVYAILKQDPDAIFESGSPTEAFEKIKERHFPVGGTEAEETPAVSATNRDQNSGPRDFTKRDRRSGNGFGFVSRQPSVPRIGN